MIHFHTMPGSLTQPMFHAARHVHKDSACNSRRQQTAMTYLGLAHYQSCQVTKGPKLYNPVTMHIPIQLKLVGQSLEAALLLQHTQSRLPRRP
jgi:hypothetical protein